VNVESQADKVSWNSSAPIGGALLGTLTAKTKSVTIEMVSPQFTIASPFKRASERVNKFETPAFMVY